MQLRPYQSELVENLRDAFKIHNRVLCVASTGSGKTQVASYIANSSKGTVYFVVHRRELIRQTALTFDKWGIDYGYIASGYEYKPRSVMICSIGTLQRRDVPSPDLWIQDEAHLSMAKGYVDTIERLKPKYLLGLTGSPVRLSGESLGGLYDVIVEAKSMKRLIEHGHLSRYNYYAPHVPSLEGIKTVAGDYNNKDITELMKGKVIDDAIGKYKKFANGMRTLLFATNIAHSKEIVSRFNDAGIKAEHFDGTTPDKKRREIIERFASGETKVLTNVAICIEGFDLAAQVDRDITIESVIMMRPTKSTALYMQMVGRALRKKSYPAVILDMAGNHATHGMPCDDREWSLEKGKAKRAVENIAVQRCPECFYTFSPRKSCPRCLHVFKADGRIISEINGELVLIGSDEWKEERRRQVDNAGTLKELFLIEKNRGYKCFWAENVYLKKTGIRLQSTKDGLIEIAKVRGFSNGWVWNRVKKMQHVF